jgi:TolB-like protein/Tfp pilus assembly protein PilF
MLTGKVPFEDNTPYAIAMKHVTKTPKAPKELDPLIPEDINHIILKCMEKEKEKRFPNVEVLLAGLEKIENATKEAMKELSAEGTVESKRIPSLAIIGIMLLGIVIIGGGYLLLKKIPQQEKTDTLLEASEWKNSIAVLPFMDLSPEQNQEHICFGMTEAINNRLTKIGILKVTSTTSVMRYKNTNMESKNIGQELGIKNILRGSVLVEGDKILVTGQLIDTETGINLWSDSFSRELESIIAVQNEVSQAIAEALKIKLTPETITILTEEKPNNIEAYEYYVKGMNFLEGRYLISNQEEDFDAAVRMFEKSKEIDPNYGQAYLGLAWSYTHRFLWSGDPNDQGRVIRNSEIAYKLNPDSSSGNAAKALSYHLSGKFEDAFTFYKQAVELNPNVSRTIFSIGVLCRNCGLYHKAVKYFERARELDPFYIYSIGGLGGSYYYLAEFEKAAFYFDKVLELNPNEPIISRIYPTLYVMMKQYDKAREMIEGWGKINPDAPWLNNSKAWVYAAKGEREKALGLDADAAVYAMVGMKDEAIELINTIEAKTITSIHYDYLSLLNLPVFDNLRDDPRFQSVLDKKKKTYEKILEWAEGL